MKVLISFLMLFSFIATAEPIDLMKISLDGHLFGKDIEYYIDHSSKLSLGDVIESKVEFSRSTKNFLGFGWLNRPLWIRFSLQNKTDQIMSIVVEHLTPEEFVTFYYSSNGYDGNSPYKQSVFDGWHSYESGTSIVEPAYDPLRSRTPYVSVTVKPRDQVNFVIKVKGVGTQAPLRIWSRDFFLKEKQKEDSILYFCFGILFMLIVINVASFLIQRSSIYIPYLVYLVSTFLLSGFMTIGFRQVSGPLLKVLAISWPVIGATLQISFLLFAAKFLRISSWKTSLIVIYPMVLSFALLPIAIYLDHSNTAMMMNALLQIAMGVLLVCLGFRSYLKGNNSSFLFGVGAMILTGSLFATSLSYSGVLTIDFFTNSAYLFGTIVESVLLSIAISWNEHIYRKGLIQEKSASIKRMEHSYQQLSKVIYAHQIERIKNGFQIEETMPTQTGHACVIAFDVVGSSKIRHMKSKEFFRSLFARCNEAMNEGYDGHCLMARAYRIKEMGDGFLCSVGYPFASLTDNPAIEAVLLAERFAKILAEESQMLHAIEPITCGIGIAIDTLTGFYPESGAKEYDLFGPALILATRYEGMRKVLFESEKSRSILIIHETVYLTLDPMHRERFHSINIKDMGIIVRDDPTATKVYYRYLNSDVETKALRPMLAG